MMHCCRKDENCVRDQVCLAGPNVRQHVPSFFKPSPENKMYVIGYFVSLLRLPFLMFIVSQVSYEPQEFICPHSVMVFITSFSLLGQQRWLPKMKKVGPSLRPL